MSMPLVNTAIYQGVKNNSELARCCTHDLLVTLLDDTLRFTGGKWLIHPYMYRRHIAYPYDISRE